MDTNDPFIPPSPDEYLPGYQPRVVVKFRDGDEQSLKAFRVAAPGNPSLRAPRQLQRLSASFPDIVVEHLFSSTPEKELDVLVRAARNADRGRELRLHEGPLPEIPDLETFYSVVVPAGVDPREVIAAAEALPGVEMAYLQSAPTPPPVNPEDDPRFRNQGYLAPAPMGIDALYAWKLEGGDGRGVDFVDIEQGWTLDHEDLAGAGVTKISGFNFPALANHGTAVLGIVLAQDNKRGCVGIAPSVRARVVAQHKTVDLKNYNTADAIVSATQNMRAGDILLLEAQTSIEGSPYIPVEEEYGVWAAIRIATASGIVVVEAGGNGGMDLDTFQHPKWGFLFRRGHADYRESRAIVAGAATSALPHGRHPSSNFGSRMDCFGWGEKIDAPRSSKYTAMFGGTSGASAIVAGAAVALQGIVKARLGEPWSPERIRGALSNPHPGVNTPSADPTTDRIGVMPNLRGIVAAESLAPAGWHRVSHVIRALLRRTRDRFAFSTDRSFLRSPL